VLSGSLVLITTFMRTDGPRRTRVMAAFSDTTILLIPVITTFVGWAFTSYVITGQPFQQYSSQYGTSAQARVSGGTPVGLSASLMTDFHFVESMAPLLPLVLVAVLVVAWRRRDALVLVPLATVGGALGVDLAGYVVGAIAGTYRYFIVTIPLGVLLVGILLSAPSARAARTTVNGAFNTPGRRVKAPRDSPPSRLRQRLSVAAMTIVAIVAVAPALPATAKEMFSSTNGGDSSGLLSFVFDRQLTASDLTVKNHYSAVLRTDQYIEGLNLPDGDILVDNFSGCIPDILTTISNPKLFVIPNDRDFRQVLADPLTFHVHYMLDPPPTGDGKLVSLNIAYPTLYATGDRFTKLVHQFPATNLCIGDDRLFHVIGHPNVG